MVYWDTLLGDDDHAADYMNSYGEGPGFELRHHLGSLINDGETVLDVGCGPGWNLDHFLEYGPHISRYKGTDYSERFVRVANQRLDGHLSSEFNPYSMGFALGDVRKIEEPDDSWDVVLFQDVLEHTNGYEKPMQEALRVAKKRVIVTFWHLADMDDPHINDDGDDGWGAWYDKREWEKYLDSLGYTWFLDELEANNRMRHVYVIDKDEPK